MKKFLSFSVGLFLSLPLVASAQNFLDPFFKAQLDLYYLEAVSNAVKSINIADGSITASKLSTGFALDPSQVSGTALTESTSFSGPNISGPFNNLVIVGFYPSSNPSNFVTLAFLNSQDFATETFVLTQGFLTNEVDPTVTGKVTTGTWVDVNSVTNVQIFSNGLLQSWTTNGVEIP